MSKHIAKQYQLLPATDPVKKPRYSYSQVEKAKCGQRYYYSKTEAREEKTYNLVAGSVLDTAFNAYYENNQHLVESHQQRLDYARAAAELFLKDNPDYFTMPWSQKAGDVRSSPENYVAWLFDVKAIELVCRHDRGPVEVQKRVELDLPHYSIVGYIDCLELDTNTVVDVKAITGWSGISEAQYALRSQVPLYRMMLQDSLGTATKGRYELLLCRKKPSLSMVPDLDIDFLQEKLIADFDALHKKLTKRDYSRNPDHCFDYNKFCPFFNKCWPELDSIVNPVESQT